MVDTSRFLAFLLLAGILGLFVVARLGAWGKRCLWRDATFSSPRGRRERTLDAFAWFITASGVAMLTWAFVEPYFPVVEEVQFSTSKLHAPLRVVQISDLHCDPTRRAEKRMVAKIQQISPDLIVFTGDGVNSDEGVHNFRTTMRALTQIAPVYGVRGNWEAWWFEHIDTFQGTGVAVLEGDARRIVVNGQPLWITGVAVDNEASWWSQLRKLPKNEFRLALHHFPQAAARVGDGADLLLAGDSHGGQIRLPLLGPLIRLTRWDQPYFFTGLHHLDNGLNLYVNRGIGMEGGRVPRVRFMVPPEITVIDLVPKG